MFKMEIMLSLQELTQHLWEKVKAQRLVGWFKHLVRILVAERLLAFGSLLKVQHLALKVVQQAADMRR